MSRSFRVWDNQVKSYDWDREFVLSSDGNLMELRSNHNGTWDYHFADEDRFIVEQDTGLKDKNGKMIREGDIVKAKIQGLWETGPDTICEGKATWNLEVVYNEIRYMDVFHILGSKNAPDTIYYLFEDILSDIEVIGNIHENPELLEN